MLGHPLWQTAKQKQKTYKNVEIPWSKKRGAKLEVAFYEMEEKKNNSGEYTGSTPAFSATHHAAQREVQVISTWYVCTLITHSSRV